jgi:hypothetical protein
MKGLVLRRWSHVAINSTAGEKYFDFGTSNLWWWAGPRTAEPQTFGQFESERNAFERRATCARLFCYNEWENKGA